MSFNAPQRDFAIDWLRVFAMLMVFLFHSGRFFDGGWWHVKNNQLDFSITIFVLFLNQWIMPLLIHLKRALIYVFIHKISDITWEIEYDGR